jgi:hypothetical protein
VRKEIVRASHGEAFDRKRTKRPGMSDGVHMTDGQCSKL